MRKKVRRRHEAQVRVQGVCAEHGAWFDATPGGQKTRADLGSDVAEADGLLALQERSLQDRHGATALCRASRRRLRDAAKAIVAVGRRVNGDAALDTLHLPGAVTDDQLLAYTRGLLERVAAHADVFAANGLPPDFLKKFEDGIAAFAAARDAQAAARQRFTAAAESILEALDRGDQTIDVLEALVVNATDAPAELLTRLRIARRVGPRVTAPAPQPPQAASPIKAA